MHTWTPLEWSQAIDGLDAQGVDLVALGEAWGVPADLSEDVILDDARHAWVLGVLAGEIEPRPIPG